MNIKKLYLVRHADYAGGGSDPSLSESGLQNATNLGMNIRRDLGQENVVIWTSSAARAAETAQNIKQELSLAEVITYPELWSDNSHRFDFDWLKEKLENFTGENLVIVSHLEYVRMFPRVLGFPGNSAGYSEGVLIENGICKNFR